MSFVTRLGVIALASAMALPALAADHTLKISFPTNNDVTLKWAQTFKEAVEKRSAGKIAVELYPANQLGQIPATIDGVSFGTIEMVVPAAGFYVNRDPRFEVFDVPGVFKDFKTAQAVLADPEVLERIGKYGNSKGPVPLAAFPHSALALVSVKPVRQVADIQGQKIRVIGPTPLHVEPFKKMGASPQSMPLGEVLPAMQNKVVDGMLAGTSVFVAFKYHDVAKAMTLMPNSFVVVVASASRAFLDKIGPDLAKIVTEEARAAMGPANEWNLKAADGILGAWQKNGGEVIRMSDAEAARYLEVMTSVMPAVMKANPALEAEMKLMQTKAAAK